ncbi:MAG: DHHW family protein [Eubacteriales bacterium]
MHNTVKNIAVTVLFALFFGAGALLCITHTPQQASLSERRKLAQLPALTWQSVLDTSFMSDFEKYTLDQFPARDSFRRIKAAAHYYMFAQKDNNGIYLADGYVSKLEYPLRESSVSGAAAKFEALREKYFAGTDAQLYYSVIPDKNYFLADKNGYPSLDYERVLSLMADGLPHFTYIDLFPYLSIEDYYRTDTHWRQECLTDVAAALAAGMGAETADTVWTEHSFSPFYGVYCGQAALPLAADTLVYLTSPILDGCTVYNYETDKTGAVYDMDMLSGNDPYNVFLSGAAAILTVENPACENDRELVVFRDSFGSSVTPLLISAYSRVTLIDIRYVQSDFLGEFLDFSGADDVLFLYSTLVLNNSTMLK